MNRLYEKYMEMVMERGYLTLEDFVKEIVQEGGDYTLEEVEEFFDIMLSNTVEGIYTKAMEAGLTDAEELIEQENMRLQKLREVLLKGLGID